MTTVKKIIHRAEERGHADHGWLNAHHSFSFAGYYNPDKTQFGMLRVLNDDLVAPGAGFGKHPHENMEIVTIPLKGALEHQDSQGNKGVIRKGEVQVMSAGTGIFHSEYNASDQDTVNLLQIWVFPDEYDIEPRYDQRKFEPEKNKNRFTTVVSPDRSDAPALWINQDAWFSLTELEKGKSLDYRLHKEGNGVYIFMIEGSAIVAGEELKKRDAAGLWDTASVGINSVSDAEVLLIEVPMKE